jgi:hypothetical protein
MTNIPTRVEDVNELQGMSARWTAALETLEVPGFAVAVVKDGAVLRWMRSVCATLPARDAPSSTGMRTW